MDMDVVQLTKDLVAVPSVSRWSNAAVSDVAEAALKRAGFEVERLAYTDDNGEHKVTVVGKKGEGSGGFALISHSDTVPGTNWDRDPFAPIVENGRLIGLGSCDMKGPAAATIAAGAAFASADLKKPIFVVVSADEEVSGGGVKQVVAESVLFKTARPEYGVIAEPTRMIPVYAHKGGVSVKVTAHGVAAHTSTDKGISANFLIAPFLAEMAELAKEIKKDARYMNHEFDPPTNGFNMVLDDGGCRPNVTAPKTICTLGFRPMPGDQSVALRDLLVEKARKYGFEVSTNMHEAYHVPPDSAVVKIALQATGLPKAETVPFGTDAFFFPDYPKLVILGPGDIIQAHTNGEWIGVSQLLRAVDVYKRMIQTICT